MKLYKYVHPDRIDILLNAVIRFSQAEAWNDPYEFQPYYQDHIVKNPLKLLHEFSKIVIDYTDNGTVPSLEQIENYEKERTRITNNDIYKYLNKKIIALSLTEERDNLLMWSHYTNSHSGFVIELNTDTDFFNSNDRYLYKVKYGKDRPNVKTNEFGTLVVELVNLITENKAVPTARLKELSKVFKKSLDWSYEKEWRLITLTENANNFKSFEDNLNTLYLGSDHYERLYIALLQLPLETISAIYVGARASFNLKRKLYLLTKYNHLYSHIKIMTTSIDDKEFKLNHREMKDLDVLKLAELKLDVNKITKWQRLTNPYLNNYYNEIADIKKLNPTSDKGTQKQIETILK